MAEPPAPGADAAWAPILRPRLRVVFIGYNPSPRSWAAGHHYAHPNNRFWALLAESGLTDSRLSPEEDVRLPDLGFGFTDIVGRATAAAADLRASELREGGAAVRQDLLRHRPRIAAYTGKGVYRAVAGLPAAARAGYGPQDRMVVPGVLDFILPSPSGRSGMPGAEKLAWYRRLALLAAGAHADPPGPPRQGPS